MTPTRAARICGHQGCPNIVVGSSRCPEHTITRSQRQAKDPAQAKFYNSTRWKKVRAIVRRNQPFCMECKRARSQTVDHLGELHDLRLEMLRALCWKCHNAKSGRDHRKKVGQ